MQRLQIYITQYYQCQNLFRRRRLFINESQVFIPKIHDVFLHIKLNLYYLYTNNIPILSSLRVLASKIDYSHQNFLFAVIEIAYRIQPS